jgi:hypothetical protein
VAGWARFVIVAALAGAIASTATAATGTRWKTYRRPAAGIRIAVPAGWQDVPLTVAGVKRRIAQLRAQKRYALAARYGEVAAAHAPLTTQAFFAFAWPDFPRARTGTEVHILVKGPVQGLGLGEVVNIYAEELPKGQGITLDSPIQFVLLSAGVAGLLHGVAELDPSYGGAKAGVTIYVLLHAKRLYTIEFVTDTRVEAQQQATFARIADRFGYL